MRLRALLLVAGAACGVLLVGSRWLDKRLSALEAEPWWI